MLTQFQVGDRAIVRQVVPQQHDYKTLLVDDKLIRDGYNDKFIQYRDYWIEREVTVIPHSSTTPSLRMGWTVMVADKEGATAIFSHEELERVS
jgi:hypothetical protein